MTPQAKSKNKLNRLDMKTFWIYVFSAALFTIGWICAALFFGGQTENGSLHLLYLFGTWFMAFPALWWYVDYFKRLFKVDSL